MPASSVPHDARTQILTRKSVRGSQSEHRTTITNVHSNLCSLPTSAHTETTFAARQVNGRCPSFPDRLSYLAFGLFQRSHIHLGIISPKPPIESANKPQIHIYGCRSSPPPHDSMNTARMGPLLRQAALERRKNRLEKIRGLPSHSNRSLKRRIIRSPGAWTCRVDRPQHLIRC